MPRRPARPTRSPIWSRLFVVLGALMLGLWAYDAALSDVVHAALGVVDDCGDDDDDRGCQCPPHCPTCTTCSHASPNGIPPVVELPVPPLPRIDEAVHALVAAQAPPESPARGLLKIPISHLG